MKPIDLLGLKLCAYQAELFERSRTRTNCSSKIFIRRFMNSELATRMDQIGFLFDSTSTDDALKELENQYGVTSYGQQKFAPAELYWIGYLYRYWAYTEGKSSKQLYKIVKPEILSKVYLPYHSLDPLQAIERIKESLGTSTTQPDDIARGVAILRKIRKKYYSSKITA